MPYKKNDRGFPNVYIKEEDQRWFESLQHVNKFKIPPQYVSKTTLKSFGIKSIEEKNAIAWMYQAHTHDPVLLYDLGQYVSDEEATENQKNKYNEYMSKLEKGNEVKNE